MSSRRRGARVVSVEPRQPFPISRLVLHYRFGAPRLGRTRVATRALSFMERMAEALPRSTWAYFVMRAIAPAG
jgi:hypothetical protein